MNLDLSVFLAELLGVLYFVVGLGILLHRKHYQSLYADILQNPGTLYISGIFALFLGFSIVTVHNVWTEDWRMIVTIVGWIAFLKGLAILVFPNLFVKHAAFWIKKSSIPGTIALVLGMLFIYFGYFVG